MVFLLTIPSWLGKPWQPFIPERLGFEEMFPHNWLQEAAARIAPHILRTALTFDTEHQIYLKWENHQVTGSFKARGAFNKVLTLSDWERERGLVAASAGNHGQGVALAASKTGAQAVIFASQFAVAAKVEAMRSLGAEVRLVPGGYGEAELAGLEYTRSTGATWVSPYNDAQVIAGQGTIGLELWSDLPKDLPTTWIVPAGGGGLVAGIGVAIESFGLIAKSSPRLLAVQSQASPFLHDLYRYGSQEHSVELPSLADGLAGPVEPGSLTIPIVKRLVHDFVLVSEAEIADAIAYCWQKYAERIEGSAAAALAAVLSGRVRQRPAVLLISGGNIQPELHRKIVSDNGLYG
jgi:threonine dehydratase